MSAPDPRDPTPESAAPTDVAPLGRTGAKPPHEQTAEEDRADADWDAIAADPDFKQLLVSKMRFILPATLFLVVYYFTLPILVGWFPDLMKTKVGSVNLAYLFAQGAFWGILLHGRPRTYTYIPDSLKGFVSIDSFSAMLAQTGYENVKAKSFILGGIGLHSAVKR